MKKFFTYNWKNIILIILGIVLSYLLMKVFTPVKTVTELNKYKLEQIETRIKEIQKKQSQIQDSITFYQSEIKKIDKKISKIKIQRNEIKNYYTVKENEIKNADEKKIDSLLRNRYKF